MADNSEKEGPREIIGNQEGVKELERRLLEEFKERKRKQEEEFERRLQEEIKERERKLRQQQEELNFLRAQKWSMPSDDPSSELVNQISSKMSKLMLRNLVTPSEAGKPVNRFTVISPYSFKDEVPQWSTARLLGDFTYEHYAPLHTALIEPTFGKFLDLYNDADPDCDLDDAFACAYELTIAARGSFDKKTLEWNEEKWNAEYIKHLRPFIDENLAQTKLNTQSCDSFGETDGTVAVNGLPVLNIELKLPANPSNAEFQNNQYFMRAVADAQGWVPIAFSDQGIWPSCFMVDIHNQYMMVVRGVVMAPPSIISTILAHVSMIAPFHTSEHFRFVKALQGLRDGVACLKRRYSSWSKDSIVNRKPLPVANHIGKLFPRNFVVYSISNQQEFVVKIGEPFTDGHLAFEVIILSGPNIDDTASKDKRAVLKIAKNRYGLDAHLAAASGDCAPKLFGYRRLEGGWHAVLMEYINLQEGWMHFNPYDESQRSAVAQAYNTHVTGNNFVHGDLRPCNVLMLSSYVDRSRGDEQKELLKAASLGPVPANEGGWHIRIIDWDWAGPLGSTRYPRTMNKSVKRAEGVKGGQPILPEHDLQQLSIPE